jgi:hypothetical protein
MLAQKIASFMRLADALGMPKFIIEHAEAAPAPAPATVYDFAAMAGLPPAGSPPMSYEQMKPADEERKARDDKWMEEMYADRAVAKTVNDREAERRAQAAGEERRRIENGL